MSLLVVLSGRPPYDWPWLTVSACAALPAVRATSRLQDAAQWADIDITTISAALESLPLNIATAGAPAQDHHVGHGDARVGDDGATGARDASVFVTALLSQLLPPVHTLLPTSVSISTGAALDGLTLAVGRQQQRPATARPITGGILGSGAS